MICYKGKLLEINNIKSYICLGWGLDGTRGYFSSIVNNRFTDGINEHSKLKEKIVNMRKYYYNYRKVLITDSELIKLFNTHQFNVDFNCIREYISSAAYNNAGEIIFTKCIDEKGRVFAREIKTGYIFPLLDNSTFETEYILTSYDSADDTYSNSNYNLEITVTPSTSIIAHAENVVCKIDVANHNEVEHYLDSFNENSDYYDDYDYDEESLLEEAKRNVFSEEIREKETTDLSLSEENIICGELKCYLNYLKLIDKSNYDKYSSDFNQLLRDYNSTELNVPITVKDLKNMLSKVKFLCLFNDKTSDYNPEGIYTTLNKIILRSYEKINGKEVRYDFPISKLDNLYELFLDNKDSLPLAVQEELLDQFACAYIYKVKEYDLNEHDLKKTHFFDLTHYIMNRIGYYNLPEINDDPDLINNVKNSSMKLVKNS